MKLHKLTLKDKDLFNRFLRLGRHELSVYAFENIFIWKGLFDISWEIISDSLCIFFQDKIGAFLYLPPLAKDLRPAVIGQVFKIMDSLNLNPSVSRIENVEARNLAFYQALGYACDHKSCDYLYWGQDLIQLKGNKFKSKRADYNYFTKHYDFEYLPFSLKYSKDCLRLYDVWMRERQAKSVDHLYNGMLEDGLNCFKIMLKEFPDLNLIGRLVKIKGEIKGMTFGFSLNKETFCVLYEVTDLSIKGLSQFIFREFCREQKEYQSINIMDDSGLGNLKKVKLSYHPVKLVPAYIVNRKNE